MLGNPEETGTCLQDILTEASKFREGSIVEIIDYYLTKELHLDFTQLPIPRILGLLRQARAEAERMPKTPSVPRMPSTKGVSLGRR